MELLIRVSADSDIFFRMETQGIFLRTRGGIHIKSVSIEHPLIQAFISEVPERIDYDEYLQNLWLLDRASAIDNPEPYKLIDKSESKTVWRKNIGKLEEVKSG